jgi:hypothetical protein
MLAEISRAGLQFSFADDVVTWKLGKPADAITSLTLSFSTNTYSANVVGAVEKQYAIRESFDAQAAADDFLLRNRKTPSVKK